VVFVHLLSAALGPAVGVEQLAVRALSPGERLVPDVEVG